MYSFPEDKKNLSRWKKPDFYIALSFLFYFLLLFVFIFAPSIVKLFNGKMIVTQVMGPVLFMLGALFSGLAPGAGAADGRRRSAGIGLSVCATIVRAHGGAIRAENRREGGAVFRFALQTEGEMDAEV